MLSTSDRRDGRSGRKLVVTGAVVLALGLLAVASWTERGAGGLVFVSLLLVPAVVGGSIALAIRLFQRRPASSRRSGPEPFGREGGRGEINMARIPVSGVSGLAFVAVAVVMALELTRVGQTLALGAIGGVAVGAIVIIYRRSKGALMSGSQGPRGRALLVPDEQAPAESDPERQGPSERPLAIGVHPR